MATMNDKENVASTNAEEDEDEEEKVGVRKFRRLRKLVLDSDDEDEHSKPSAQPPAPASKAASTSIAAQALAPPVASVPRPALATPVRPAPGPAYGPEEPASAFKALMDEFSAALDEEQAAAESDEDQYATPPEADAPEKEAAVPPPAPAAAPRSLADELFVNLDEEEEEVALCVPAKPVHVKTEGGGKVQQPVAVKTERPAPASAHEVVDLASDSEEGGDGEKVNDEECAVCDKGGDILLCDGCPRSYHIECILLKAVPETDDWLCPVCSGYAELVHDRRAEVQAARERAEAERMREPVPDPGAASSGEEEAECVVLDERRRTPARAGRRGRCLADQIAASCDAEGSGEEEAGDRLEPDELPDDEGEYESSPAASSEDEDEEEWPKKGKKKGEEVMFGGGGFATERIDQKWEPDEDGDLCLEGDGDYTVPRKAFERLFPYQREGVAWLCGLHKARKGGILGDDMGLGKTIQLLTFLQCLFFKRLARCALVVCPKSLLEHWRKAAGKWCRLAKVFLIYGGTIPGRQKAVQRLLQTAGRDQAVLALTTFETLASRPDVFTNPPVPKGGRWTNDSEEWAAEDDLAEARDPSLVGKIKWDLVACDEGHLLKNAATARSRAVAAVRARHRLILTGTPVQNNLRELWALFRAVEPDLLGGIRAFAADFDGPIAKGCVSDASSYEKAYGNERSVVLRDRIRPHFLRREKVKILRGAPIPEDGAEDAAPAEDPAGGNTLPRKTDLIVWIPLSPDQERIYRAFLETPDVQNLLLRLDASESAARHALPKLTVMKKICDHPRLLLRRPEMDAAARRRRQAALQAACRRAEAASEGALLEEGDEEEEEGEAPADLVEALGIDTAPDAEVVMAQSAKLRFAVTLVQNLADEGHKVLIFARYVRTLDIIHRALADAGVRLLRVDGSVKDPAERQRLVDKFNGRKSITAFLLSTQVGGLGFTLTGADRVIIYDPSWNPSADNQAVDRAYRIGQTRDVLVYRLLTCNTIEEKIYRRQVYKEGLTKTALLKENQFRYFSFDELKNLFQLGDTSTSPTQMQLAELHGAQRAGDEAQEAHLAFLHSLGIFGCSSHDLLYSRPAEAVEDEAAASEARKASERCAAVRADAGPEWAAPSPAPVPRRERKTPGKGRAKGGAGGAGTPWKGSILAGASPLPAALGVSAAAQAAMEEDLKKAMEVLGALKF